MNTNDKTLSVDTKLVNGSLSSMEDNVSVENITGHLLEKGSELEVTGNHPDDIAYILIPLAIILAVAFFSGVVSSSPFLIPCQF